jgi:hypothetical protein
MLANPSYVMVRIGVDTVGSIAVSEIRPAILRGVFTPGIGFEKYRQTFDAASEACRHFDESMEREGEVNYVLWNQMLESNAAIVKLGPALVEISRPISGFTISTDGQVEIAFDTFKESVISGLD